LNHKKVILPSDIFKRDFQIGRQGNHTNQAVFKSITRSYVDRLITPKDKVDVGRYYPRFTSVAINQTPNTAFKQGQQERRSLFFEGIPEKVMVGA